MRGRYSCTGFRKGIFGNTQEGDLCMKNLKVSAKLMTGFLIVTALSVLLAVVGIFASTSINGDYTYLLNNPIERERYLRDAQYQFTMLRYRSANFAMEAGNSQIIQDTLTPQFNEAFDSLNAALEGYITNNTADPRREQSLKDQYNGDIRNIQVMAEAFRQEGLVTRELALAGEAAAATESLRDAIPVANEIVAAINELVVPAVDLVNTQSATANSTAMTLTFVLAGVAAFCAVLSIVLAIYISGLIAKPLAPLTQFMSKAGQTGDLAMTQTDVDVIGRYGKIRDEIGQTIAACAAFATRVTEVSQVLSAVAEGDLTVGINPLSDHDTLGVSLQKMTDNLNGMFGDINMSASQVSAGAGQIADGAQALASGSTEQAASVQELSSSIAEIAQRTKHNAEMAEQAAQFAETIMDNAHRGTEQMNEMMMAVREISEASQSIGRVMKTIDEIAFQTNILALNASVEAARAGEHGKGFGVVAEEVRTLSAKSAAAASDTGHLIANSMEKAELGVRIAEETSASLSQIVTGIGESTQLITEIAKSSEEQSSGIAQINVGIDQVAQVVQQNSATAQESAAASQEMSGQSSVLQDLIMRFKIRDDRAHHRLSLPSAAEKG